MLLSVLVRVLEITGKEHIDEVWPNLEVFFHGGIAFTPYRPQYEHIITSDKMHYMETYNGSEGFFGIQNDPADKSMLLMLDYGVFYEFIPMDEFGREMSAIRRNSLSFSTTKNMRRPIFCANNASST